MLGTPSTVMRSQHGLITARQARETGLDARDLRQRVKREEWHVVRRGVYVEMAQWEELDEYVGRPLLAVRAAGLVIRAPRFVFSHASSALLLGLGIPIGAGDVIHVTRHKVHGDAVRAGIKHHRAPFLPDETVEIDGLRALGPVRTALDLTREHGAMAGTAACDQVLAKGATREELTRALERMHCWPQSRAMREAIGLADPGAESWLESEARYVVSGLGLGRPRTQVGLTDGRQTVWLDFLIGRHAFEADGAVKYRPDNLLGVDPKDAVRREKARQDFIQSFNLGVSRITWHDCHAGRKAAEARILREYAATSRLFGESTADLSPYLLRRSSVRAA